MSLEDSLIYYAKIFKAVKLYRMKVLNEFTYNNSIERLGYLK